MKTLITRKSFLISMIGIILLVGAASYMVFGRSTNKDVDEDISNAVTEIEKGRYELNNLKINYDEYSQKTEKYLSKYFTSFYKNTIYSYDDFIFHATGRHYEEKDWKGMSLDEIKKIGEPLYNSLKLHLVGYFYNSYDISRVYDDTSNPDDSLHYKHIFITYTDEADNKKLTFYKQYTFKKEGNKYVLFAIRNLTSNVNKELMYGNKKVEYTHSINL